MPIRKLAHLPSVSASSCLLDLSSSQSNFEGHPSDSGTSSLRDLPDSSSDLSVRGVLDGLLLDVLRMGGKTANLSEHLHRSEYHIVRQLTRHSVFSLTIVMSTILPSVPSTLFTGLTLAYRSISFLNATIGLEYPSTLLLGLETAPNMAALHSALRV